MKYGPLGNTGLYVSQLARRDDPTTRRDVREDHRHRAELVTRMVDPDRRRAESLRRTSTEWANRGHAGKALGELHSSRLSSTTRWGGAEREEAAAYPRSGSARAAPNGSTSTRSTASTERPARRDAARPGHARATGRFDIGLSNTRRGRSRLRTGLGSAPFPPFRRTTRRSRAGARNIPARFTWASAFSFESSGQRLLSGKHARGAADGRRAKVQVPPVEEERGFEIVDVAESPKSTTHPWLRFRWRGCSRSQACRASSVRARRAAGLLASSPRRRALRWPTRRGEQASTDCTLASSAGRTWRAGSLRWAAESNGRSDSLADA